jgi:hypothetical protein
VRRPSILWGMRRALAVTAVLTLGAALCVGDARADDKNRCIAASEQGQQLRDSGKYKGARDAFTKCARDACPTIVRRDCTRWLADLTQLWPSVVFGAKDPSGNDRTDVTVSVDGASMVSTLDGKPVQIEPGEHVFRFETQGFPAVERDLLVRAGEKSRLVVAQFGNPPAAPTPAATPAGPTPAHADAPIPTGVWVFGGLALAAFGAEAFFGISGLNARSSLESSPCAKTATCNPDDVTSVRTKFTVADIALGVGVVSAALSAYLYFSRGSAVKPESTSSHLDLCPTPGGAAATWQLRF